MLSAEGQIEEASRKNSVADANRPAVARLLALLAQLGALLLMVFYFRIESEAFFRVFLLTVVGFGVHYFLPLRHRLPFFVSLSLVAVVIVLGLEQAAWLVGLALAILGLAHAPISFSARVGGLLLAGLALATARWTFPRWNIDVLPWSTALWPILGSMFVFRLIVYLYDRKHQTAPVRISQILGYFFLLPNVCFPLFPVVDFKRFCRNYYDIDRHDIYQTGVEWIWRGLAQLVLYRLVYYHLTLDPVAVEDLAGLAAYMVSTFMLYVRVSGQFHLVIGILHLFGFHLPETHHRYFLASSFTDFWRRINIYWKDFMMKVFFYPAFFKLRALGSTRALILATAYVFVITWFLHTVQWFWIRGSIFVEPNDLLFWTILGLLVIINSLHESKHGRARSSLKPTRTLRESAGIVLRTFGTFTVLCILWSLWTSESVSDWLLMWASASSLPPWSALQMGMVVIAVMAIAAGLVVGLSRNWGTAGRIAALRESPVFICSSCLGMCLVVSPLVSQQLGATGQVLASLREVSLNRRDAEQFQRGYYENLVEVRRFNDEELWRLYEQTPDGFVRSLSQAGLSRNTSDNQEYELLPSASGRFLGASMRTNRWGMRDKDYPLDPPGGTYRLALLGPSTAMGSGVEDGETFESLLEAQLNQADGNASARTYEILNFGVAGYQPLQILHQLQHKVLAFKPNAVLYVGHASDLDGNATHWAAKVRSGTPMPDRTLSELAERTGIGRHTGHTEARRRIKPHRSELLGLVYRQIVKEARNHQVQPVFVYLQTVLELSQTWQDEDHRAVVEEARQAGFLVMDLTGAYGTQPQSRLWIATGDGHPNALGNRLIADRLRMLLAERVREFALGPFQ
ncbi:MAG: GDSL-type esterase/lipase family protein [Vicinamibacterales bacterium]